MKTKYNSLKLKNQLCYPIYLCSKEIIRRYTPFLKEINLTYTQYVVMMYFWEVKTSNVKEISKALLIDSATLTPLLKKLEKKEYITRKKSTKDERNLEIKITEKGLKLRDKAITIPEKMAQCIDLSKEDVEIFSKILYKILINIEKEK